MSEAAIHTTEPRPGQSPGGAVRIEGLSKTFPGQVALDDVSLDIREGEIHGLVGQNGSGKSTLIKCLSGFHSPDPGAKITIAGETHELADLPDALRSRMKFIHQDLALVPTLTVRENLGLDRPGAGFRRIDAGAERARTRELLSVFDADIDPDAVVGTLPPFARAAVAIARGIGAMDEDVELLVLDEPTASLGAVEAEELFRALRQINGRGIPILYVSHFLNEVISVVDRVTVIRDGRKITVQSTEGMTEEALVHLIVGHELDSIVPPSDTPVSVPPTLSVRDVYALGIDGISLDVRPGEVVGLTGLVGSGYQALAQCLAGSTEWDQGTVTIGEQTMSSLDPRKAAAAGLVSVPADRANSGLIPTFTISENVTLPDTSANFRGGFLRKKAERKDVIKWIEITDVQPPDPNRKVQQLSGGNQQKVMIAKALRLEPEVIVFSEPTQSVDVGASASIRRLICELAESGKAVLVVSSDPEELEQVAKRVLITRNGRIACELTESEVTEDRIAMESQFEGEKV